MEKGDIKFLAGFPPVVCKVEAVDGEAVTICNAFGGCQVVSASELYDTAKEAFNAAVGNDKLNR